jgi:acetyltransferase-like isoleucine patch superfamily enzyme
MAFYSLALEIIWMNKVSEIVRHISRNVKIENDVKIWHFTYIGDDTEIGDGTKIGSLVHVDYGVKIGRNCKIEGMAYIPPLTVIGDGVFVGPGVIFTNDPSPESPRMVGVQVEPGAIICAGAVLKAGVRVGARSVVGMGAVVTRDVTPESVVFGNPARVRYPLSEYLEKKRGWEEEG